MEILNEVVPGSMKASFPAPQGWSLRPAQVDLIEKIQNAFDSGKKVVAVQAPTGSGKSLVGVTVALAFARSYYLVPLKALQDQISKDFGETLNIFKGKSNYICTQYPSQKMLAQDPNFPKYRVSDAPCQERGMGQQRKHCREEKICHYYNAFNAASEGEHALMNFSLYLAWMRLRDTMPERAPFTQRPIHIIDEAHKVEDFIRDHLTVELSTNSLKKYLDITYAEVENLDEDSIFDFMKILIEKNNVKLDLMRKEFGENLEAVASEIGSDRLDFHLSLAEKLDAYFEHHDNYVFALEERFTRGKENKYIVVKPLFVGGYVKSHVAGEQTLLLSATLSRRAVAQLGFTDEEVEYIDLPSTFPKENRVIRFDSVGKINRFTQDKLAFNVAEKIEKVLTKYPDSKGIVHVPSYKFSEQIVERMDDVFKVRLLIQTKDDGSAKEILREHLESPDPTVLFTPGMKEGVDLKNDLARFQVIVKCPYPNMGDPVVAKLTEKDHLWMVTKTITDFMQMYGRSIRSETDFADTICLDENIRVLLRDYKNYVPQYILEAIKWLG